MNMFIPVLVAIFVGSILIGLGVPAPVAMSGAILGIYLIS